MTLAQPATQAGDVVVAPTAAGIGFRLVAANGSVGFTVPPNWAVVSMKSSPPVAVAVFQIPNPADKGAPDSTNVAVSIFHLEAETARSARAGVGKPFGREAPVTSQYAGWTVYAQEAPQGSTTYRLMDAVRDLPVINAAVAVRLAWPRLAGNGAGYDADMIATFHRLLDSVSSAPGPYSPRPGEIVRRPTD